VQLFHAVRLAILAEEAGQPLPGDTLTVRTPTGGLHLYAVPAGVVLRSTAGERGNGLGWKFDTRAWGGYVVAPGSTTPDGRYEPRFRPVSRPGPTTRAGSRDYGVSR
jgi:bifunctional DNA primase/polymerase-like protein